MACDIFTTSKQRKQAIKIIFMFLKTFLGVVSSEDTGMSLTRQWKKAKNSGPGWQLSSTRMVMFQLTIGTNMNKLKE